MMQHIHFINVMHKFKIINKSVLSTEKHEYVIHPYTADFNRGDHQIGKLESEQLLQSGYMHIVWISYSQFCMASIQ